MSEEQSVSGTEYVSPERVTVVTNDNFEEYVEKQLGPAPSQDDPPAQDEDAEEDKSTGRQVDKETSQQVDKSTPEEAAQSELEDLSKPKEGDVKGNKVFFDGKWVGKHDFDYRIHVVKKAKEAEYSSKLAEAEAKIQSEVKAREELEKSLSDMKSRYEPPKQIMAEPKASDFTDIEDYSKALKEWVSDTVIREENFKREQQKLISDWNQRQESTKQELPDYEEKIKLSDVQVSDLMKEAIIESEVGPKILYHLAEHPDVAEALGKMTGKRMLIELGKIESVLSTKKTDKPQKVSNIAEMSRAPSPITPLRGASSPVGVKIDINGEFTGTFEEYKAARKAGKIR